MKKKEIRAVLDDEMRATLNYAISASDRGYYSMALHYMTQATEVMHVASRFGIINEAEFDNINKTLNYSNIPYEPIN